MPGSKRKLKKICILQSMNLQVKPQNTVELSEKIDCGILPCGNTLIGLPIAQVQHHLLGNPYQSPFWRQTKGIQSKGEQNGGHNPSSKVFYIIPLIRVHLAWISFFGGGDYGIGCVSLSISPS